MSSCYCQSMTLQNNISILRLYVFGCVSVYERSFTIRTLPTEHHQYQSKTWFWSHFSKPSFKAYFSIFYSFYSMLTTYHILVRNSSSKRHRYDGKIINSCIEISTFRVIKNYVYRECNESLIHFNIFGINLWYVILYFE